MQKRAPGAARFEQLAHFPIRLHVGAPEAVDRLLRVADDEQLARHRGDAAPVALGGIRGAQEQEDFRLQRIGVLELVDEEMREPVLKGAPDARMRHQQIAGAQQQIDEVQRACAALQRLVAGDDIPQLLAQERGEIAVGGTLKRVELGGQRLVGGPDLVARHVRSVRAFAPAPGAAEVPVLRQIDDPRLPAVGVRDIEALRGAHLVAQLADEARVVVERITHRRRLRGQRRDVVHARQHSRKLRVAIERIAAPHAVEVAPFGQLAPRPANPIDWPFIVVAAIARPDAAPQGAAHPLGWMLQPIAQPDAERLVEDPFGARLGEHLEQRVDARLDGALAQQVGAEAVNRADVGFLETLDGVRQIRLRVGSRVIDPVE